MSKTKDIKEEKLQQSLNYKPEITYQDEYDSTVTLQEEQITVTVNHSSIQQDIIDNMAAIDGFLPGLDPSIRNLIEGVYLPVRDLWEEIKDEEYKEITQQNEITIITPEDEDDRDPEDEGDDDDVEDDEDDDLPPPTHIDENFNDPVHILIVEHPKIQIIEEEYIKHLYDLLDLYTENLLGYISNYWMQLAPILSSKTVDSKRYILKDFNSYNKEDFKDVAKNKKHMADFAVRTEISRKHQISFLQKMFPLDETLIKLRNFKAAYELRKKYAEISTINENTKSATDHNNLLEASNVIYDDKYDKSYFALYKYLNSATKKVEDALTLMVHEAKAKQYLK